MHRSGTSALAGLFSILGCKLAAHTMEPSKANERGFFESTAIRDLNEELLAATGSTWDDFTRFNEEWLRSAEADEFLDRGVAVLLSEFGTAKLFVLKDPRICRLVPFWTAALERFGCAVKPVLTIRNPIEVGYSLFTKKKFSEPLGQMIWLRHVLDAERATRGATRFHTSFEQLMRSWESVAQGTQQSLDLVWPKQVGNVEFEVAKFLSHDLRHFKEAPDRVLTSGLLPDWLRETYDILNGWAENGERSGDYEALDRIGAEFDQASAAFARVVRGEREVTAQEMQRAQAIEQTGGAREAELNSMISSLREQRDQLKSQATASTAKGEKDRNSAEARQRSLELQLATVKLEAEQQRARAQADRSESDTLRQHLESRITELGQCLQEQKAAAESELTVLQSGLAESEVARQTLEKRLADVREALQSKLVSSEAARQALEKQLADEREALQSELADSERRCQALDTQLADERESLQAQRAAVHATSAERDQLRKSLQETRREATLLKAELHQLKEERETLLSELSASRTRRKEAARVIARRDAEIEARYRELAALELHMVRYSIFWKLKRLWQNIGRGSTLQRTVGP
jgi:hypothetical protein